MAKKNDKRGLIKLDAENDKALRELSKVHPMRPSMARLANSLIRNGLPDLIIATKGQ